MEDYRKIEAQRQARATLRYRYFNRWRNLAVESGMTTEEAFAIDMEHAQKGIGLPLPKDELDNIAASLWRDQRDEAIEYVARFKQAYTDPATRDGVQSGVVDLMYGVFGLGHSKNMKADIQWAKVTETLVTIFERSLPENQPEDIQMETNPRGFNFFSRRRYEEGILILPRYVTLLIKAYGLDTDGMQTDPGLIETSAQFRRPSRDLARGHRQLQLNEDLRQLILGRLQPVRFVK